jgi:trans-2,3-dihydro-3-hydroxyanthranilate isomerase
LQLEFHTLDVFTATPFAGNPLAVVLHADGVPDGAMQAIAREFNLSETVFVLPPDDPRHSARLRIFTPFGELPFAGHPTIGTAILLARLEAGGVSQPSDTRVLLEETIGLVAVAVRGLGDRAPYAELAAPALPRRADDVAAAATIAAALGLAATDIGFDGHAPSRWEAGNSFLFVPLTSRAALARVRIDIEKARALGAVTGIYAYCSGTSDEVDFHARMFAPLAGTFEDPATGSAAAVLPGPLCAARRREDGLHRWRIAQGEDMGRPSTIFVAAEVVAGAPTAVRVGGHAAQMSRGVITA